jgi:hypothetical protein
MIINKWIKIKGQKYPLVETPLSKEELIELQDNYRKFFLHDHKHNKISVEHSNRVSHTYKIQFGERGMYYVIGSAFAFLSLLYIKKKVKQKVSKFNPFYTSPEMQEFLDNLEKAQNNINGGGGTTTEAKAAKRKNASK